LNFVVMKLRYEKIDGMLIGGCRVDVLDKPQPYSI